MTNRQKVEDFLTENNILYTPYDHEAVFTVEEANKVDRQIPAFHTKNLFIKTKTPDKSKKYYLICMDAKQRLDIKEMKKLLKIKDLSFASSEELKEKLDLTPGSVSFFGMINTKKEDKITLVLQSKLLEAKSVGFHPNINTSTFVLEKDEFKKAVAVVSRENEVLELGF